MKLIKFLVEYFITSGNLMLIDQTKGNVSLFCIVISKIVIGGTCAESNNLEVFPQVVVQV